MRDENKLRCLLEMYRVALAEYEQAKEKEAQAKKENKYFYTSANKGQLKHIGAVLRREMINYEKQSNY